MDKQRQQEIIESLCDNLKEALLSKLNNVPDNWDGFELREWAAEYFKDHFAYTRMKGARLKEYKNDCLVNNLY